MTISCAKQTLQLDSAVHGSNATTLEQFAVLLSKAIYAEPKLRDFIKTEALEKIDYDYDVFYPYVSNVIIDGARSFEEILSLYDEDNILPSVLAEHPLLTILVPDWSWVHNDCFSVKKWDSSLPDIGVSYLSDSADHEVFWNGQYAFTMHDGEFSSAPILIVKDNDRLVAGYQTKGNGVSYCFFSDDFVDLSQKREALTKTTSKYTDYTLPCEVADETVSTGVLSSRTSNAYGIALSDSRIYHRDHIYYGMTSQTDSGSVNRNYYETLYRFKLSPNAGGLLDDAGNDYKTKDYYYEANIVGSATKLTTSRMQAMSWGEGAAELKIKVYLGGVVIEKNASVSFADAFNVKKVRLRENFNRLNALKSRTYYLVVGDDASNNEWLEPKWINANLQLFYWDLSQFPTFYLVKFEEYDPASKIVVSEERTYNFAANIKTSIEASGSLDVISIKRGYGYGVSGTYSQTFTNTVETTQSSDDLGSFIVQYTDKVVLNKANSRATIKTYSTGHVDAQIIPFYE